MENPALDGQVQDKHHARSAVQGAALPPFIPGEEVHGPKS